MTTNIRNTRQVTAPRNRFGTPALLLTCAVMVTGGFFIAARQHFASMDYGMKNSRLRRQIDQLESEKRRLMLAREISLSPTEIKKAVKKVGFAESGPDKTVATVVSLQSGPKSTATGTGAGPLITKTASVRPVRPSMSTVVKGVRTERMDKKGLDTE